MVTTTAAPALPVPELADVLRENRQAAAEKLYRAEQALHDANQSHVDLWIAAAYDKLHIADQEYVLADAALAEFAHCAATPPGTRR